MNSDGRSTKNCPLLTIAIPTWNRASFLAQTLGQLRREVATVAPGTVEILVSDNSSSDRTPDVVREAQTAGLGLRYVRNLGNIGPDANIAQCFNLAEGRYVLILGDDDLPVDGALSWLLGHLASGDYGVVCMRPYGFEADFRKESPGNSGREKAFHDGGHFLIGAAHLITLISSNVINKQLLRDVDANAFCGGELVQVHLIIRAALIAKTNLHTNRYWIACKRNNFGERDFSKIFVEELLSILDRYQSMGLTATAIRAIENRLLVGYYPFYLLRHRVSKVGDLAAINKRFTNRFAGNWRYYLLIAPILCLPRPLAILWGAGATVVGRLTNGDLRRGVMFAWNRARGI